MSKKFAVYGRVVGTKYLGEFEAESEEAAIEQATKNGEDHVSLCHQCSGECEDPEIDEVRVEEAS